MRELYIDKLATRLLTAVLFSIAFFAAAMPAAANNCRTSLTSGGYTTTAGARSNTPPSHQTPAGMPLAVSLNLGDVSPFNNRGLVVAVVPVRLSAGCDYKVEIVRTGSAGVGGLKPGDIGFGVRNFRADVSGSKHLSGDALNVSALSQFVSDPRNVKMMDGLPRFPATLENVPLGMRTVILEGRATTDNEHVGSQAGSIIADLVFVVVPQYFEPTDGMNMGLEIAIRPAL